MNWILQKRNKSGRDVDHLQVKRGLSDNQIVRRYNFSQSKKENYQILKF